MGTFLLIQLRFTYHGGAGRNRNCHFLLSMILLVGIELAKLTRDDVSES
jgi:hypothetical protein